MAAHAATANTQPSARDPAGHHALPGFARHGSYWNPRLLHGFTLHMSGHGRCINETLMLFDVEYARAKLREACAMEDQTLQQLAVEMLSSMGAASRMATVSAAPAITH